MRAYIFTPQLVGRVWGSDFVSRDELPIGERWLLSDYPVRPTKIARGAMRGMTIQDLIGRYGREFWGKAPARDRFPILVKQLTSRCPLPLQVHPARGPETKNECWYVQKAPPGTWVINGWLGEHQEVVKSLRGQEPLQYLERHPISPGMLVTVPAGAPHALGPHMVVLEIQDTADVTYRLNLWDHPEWGLPLAPTEASQEFVYVDQRPQFLQGHSRIWERAEWRIRVVHGDSVWCPIAVPTLIINGSGTEWILSENSERLTVDGLETVLVLPGLSLLAETRAGFADWIVCEVV